VARARALGIERPLPRRRAQGAAGEPEILGYADKYVGGGHGQRPRELPATSTPSLEPACARRKAVAHLASVRGVTRIDFLSDGNELVVNEITPSRSLARYLWIEPAVPFAQLLDTCSPSQRRPTHVQAQRVPTASCCGAHRRSPPSWLIQPAAASALRDSSRRAARLLAR